MIKTSITNPGNIKDSSERSESEVYYDEIQEQQNLIDKNKYDLKNNSENQNQENLEIYDQEEFQRLLDQLYCMHVQQEIQAREYRQCKKCINVMKPPRTHHCSQCKTCILKMDHHCQWVDNCIGFYNYKYFVCMLIYA
ncbi:hypothetical protein IMG5_033890, partial [Ichthyophthirius multifiliis]